MTEFNNKVSILATLYALYNDDEDMEDFFEYNDLGLPMAYLINEDLVSLKDKGILYIEETWKLFLDSLEIEDTGFETLDQMLALSKME